MVEETGKITVIIKDPQWNISWQFVAEEGKNIAEMAKDNEIIIPLSCRAGVCWVCLCKVLQWWDILKADAFNVPCIPLQTDENWNPIEILACIAWFKQEAFTDGKNHEVVLQRTY